MKPVKPKRAHWLPWVLILIVLALFWGIPAAFHSPGIEVKFESLGK